MIRHDKTRQDTTRQANPENTRQGMAERTEEDKTRQEAQGNTH